MIVLFYIKFGSNNQIQSLTSLGGESRAVLQSEGNRATKGCIVLMSDR